MVQLKLEFIHHRDTEIAPKATENFNFILENEKTTRALFLLALLAISVPTLSQQPARDPVT